MFSRISDNAENKTISWPGPAVLPFLLRFQSYLRIVFSWPGRLARARSPPWGHRWSAAALAEPRCIAAEKDLFNVARDLLSSPWKLGENTKVVVFDWFAESPLGMTFATEWHPCYPWRCLLLELTRHQVVWVSILKYLVLEELLMTKMKSNHLPRPICSGWLGQ